MQQLRKKQKIVTHSGNFHPDELMAISLLAKFYFGVEVSKLDIVRTRDLPILSDAKQDTSVFVLDVGREFDSGSLNFDHHQSDPNLIWKDSPEIPKSACGLIFDWLQEKHCFDLLEQGVVDDIKKLSKEIDAGDNGVKDWEFYNSFNIYNYGENEDLQFGKALNAMSEFLNSYCYKSKMLIDNRKLVKEAVAKAEKSQNPEIVILEEKMVDFAMLVAEESERALYAVIKMDNETLIQSVPITQDRFAARKLLPEEWLDFEKKGSKINTDIPEMKFCHKLRFVASFSGDFKNVVKIVERTLGRSVEKPDLKKNKRSLSK